MLAVNQCQRHFLSAKALAKGYEQAQNDFGVLLWQGEMIFQKNETLMKIAAKHDKSVVQTKVKISNTCHFERSDQAACKA